MNNPFLRNMDVTRMYTAGKLAEIEEYDERLYLHCLGVASVAMRMAAVFGYSECLCNDFWFAGALHDYGKLFVDKKILDKPMKYNQFDRNVVEGHVSIGANLLSADGILSDIAIRGIREHHERDDGEGYPEGSKASDISMCGRILAVADVYDALISKRVYKESMTAGDAIEVIKGVAFSDKIVKALEMVVRDSNCI